MAEEHGSPDRWTSGPGPDRPAGQPAEEARRALAREGSYLMEPDAVATCLGMDDQGWSAFAAHWEDLAPDTYAAELGTRRLRRHGRFRLSRAGELRAQEHADFVQPQRSNPLYVGVDRRFEPLTPAFAGEPVLASLIRMLGRVAACLDDADAWDVQVHPFRIMAGADSEGEPTPEGRHRDGVTLVTSLLIGRENATGGQSTVYGLDGTARRTTTLSRPGTLLLGDDRATLHGVSPIHPRDTTRPARRDVLVTTLTPH
ncbi:2OG-Fe dioxygenase family protein [Streptomyces venezuelae]|uniref:2OG-Fe dioxygenase family protein n=1 Tax=Streptomyces venezuelae TaxID=54571 RepID=UPI003665DC6D